MEQLVLEEAKEEDAQVLAEISRQAFDSDVQVGAAGEGGPPGYDSPEWQKAVMQNKARYFKVLLDGKIVGGIIVFEQGYGHYYLGRMFLAPAYHRKGLGLRAVDALFEKFPSARRWTLETPPWNARTRAFYQKLGFQVKEETEEDTFFEKIIP